MEFDLATPQSTAKLGDCIGKSAQPGDTLLLIGDLGTGKTTLTQAIARALSIQEKVTSPTFTLINEYEGRLPLFHFDIYRIEAAQADEMGIWEYWEDARGLVVIEWAERLGARPDSYLEIKLSHTGEESRRAEIAARGNRPQAWLEEIKQCWS